MQIANRRLPVPKFSTSKLNATAMQIMTSALKITLGGAPHDPPAAQCTDRVGVDWRGNERSKMYPDGVNDTTLENCCSLCEADPACKFFSYGTSGEYAKTCWPLSMASGSQTSPNRTSGSPNSVGPSVDVVIEFTGVDGKPTTWCVSTPLLLPRDMCTIMCDRCASVC